jgi:hypothetical protein
MMGLVPAEDEATVDDDGVDARFFGDVAVFGLEISLEAAAVAEDGDAALARLVLGEADEQGALRFEAGLSEELPDEDSLDGEDLDLSLSTVTLISAELDLLLLTSHSSSLDTISLGLFPSFDAASPLAEPEESLPLLELEVAEEPVVEVDPPLMCPVSAPIWLQVLASMASGLDFESI